jgi:hypothetical protein
MSNAGAHPFALFMKRIGNCRHRRACRDPVRSSHESRVPLSLVSRPVLMVVHHSKKLLQLAYRKRAHEMNSTSVSPP